MTDTALATAPQTTRETVSFSGVTMDQTAGGGSLSPKTLGDVVAFASLMARSQHAIPKHLRENPGACLAVTMQALRWQMDPFAVASKTYNVKDQVAYEAQVVAAAVNTLAPLKSRPRIEFSGEGDTRVCTVTADFSDGSTHQYVSPPIAQIPTKNSPLWKGDPDQQLGYYSVRSFARRHCPEVILGVYTPEELDNAPPLRDVTPAKAGIMERLPGNQGGGGFRDQVVEDGIATQQPVPADEIEAILEGDQIPTEFPSDDGPSTPPVVETEQGEVREPSPDHPAADDFPGDREPTSPAAMAEPEPNKTGSEAVTFDPLLWATEVNGRLDGDEFATVASLDAFTSDPVNSGHFADLNDASPGIAKSLQAAILGRRKALADRERSQ